MTLWWFQAMGWPTDGVAIVYPFGTYDWPLTDKRHPLESFGLDLWGEEPDIWKEYR